MKLIVQIPCHNESKALPATLSAIPEHVEGIDELEILVIDDGSTDDTAAVATQHGADRVLVFSRRKGLARAFKAGIDAALELGADVIVNTDGDNQYDGADIPRLVAPILAGEADIVVGDRDAGSLMHFSFVKRRLQRLGSWVARRLSGTGVADAPSGFRAYNREAALRLNVVTEFTYTLETLIQAGKRRLTVLDVPVRARATNRRSRLAPTMWHYVTQAGATMARAYALYEPLKIFTVLGVALMVAGVAIGLRFVYFFMFTARTSGNIQSLILAAILSIVGFQILCLAILADLLAVNRKLMEEILYRVRRRDLDASAGGAPATFAGEAPQRETVGPGAHGAAEVGSATAHEGDDEDGQLVEEVQQERV